MNTFENIRTYIKPHGSNGEGEGGTTIIINKGKSNYDSKNLNVTNLNAVYVTTDRLKAEDIKATNISADYIEADQADINKINNSELVSTNANIDNLHTNAIETNTLDVKNDASIKDLVTENIQSTNIVTDNLTVNKSAHFFELIIDKMRSVQGTQIITAANCVADLVQAYKNNTKVNIEDPTTTHYRIYWKRKDNDGRDVTNDWLVNDQAFCESFNNVTAGHNYDVSNKYYWRLVKATDNNNPVWINFDSGQILGQGASPANPFHIEFSAGFMYDDGTTSTDDFVVQGDRYDSDTQIWYPESTGETLTITSPDYFLVNGAFIFDTDELTKINITFFYEDGTSDYHPATVYDTSYYLNSMQDKNITKIVLTTAVIDKWEQCNWIDLSNASGEYDSTTVLDKDGVPKNGIPSVGDNIAQLGYRYNLLNNPDQEDIDRASAIIIAAYDTPDRGNVQQDIPKVYPPSYAQYQYIRTFELTPYRMSYFDAQRAKFVGEFEVNVNGNKMPLDDYIQSVSGNNPLTLYVNTNNNENVDLIMLQGDSSGKIYNLNNFPNNMQILMVDNGTPMFDPDDYSVLSLTLFGIEYDLLNYVDRGQTGIYLSSVSLAHAGQTPSPFRLQFNWRQPSNPDHSQTVTSSSINIYAEDLNGNQAKMTIPISIVNSTPGVDGQDGEIWRLMRDTCQMEVDNNGKLSWLVRYGVQHIIGSTVDTNQPETGMCMYLKFYNINNQYIVPSSSHFNYDNYDDLSDWNSSGGKFGGYWQFNTYNNLQNVNWYTLETQYRPTFAVVELQNSNHDVLATDVITITLQDISLFQVKDGLLLSIQGKANQTDFDTLENNVSIIEQDVDSIKNTVTQQTTSINNLTTSVGEIRTQANNISIGLTQTNTNLETLETNIQNTGIDIEHGKITLTAENTIIDGNLSVHNADEGLVIYDNATDTPKIAIQGDTLGTLSTSGPVPKVNDTYDTLGTVSSNTCIFNIVDLGQLAQNNKIAVNVNIYRRQIAGTIVGTPTYNYKLYCNNTLVQELTGATSGIISDPTYYRFTTSQFTIPSDGNYTISITITTQGGTDGDIFSAGVYVTRWLNTMQKIAKDGAVFGTDGRNYSWFGSDQTVLSRGVGTNELTKIVLNGDGVGYTPKSDAYGFGEIGSQTSVKFINSNYYYKASVYDGLICLLNGITGDPFYLWLPDPQSCPGKIYYVKQVGTSTNVHVYAYNPNYDIDPSLPQYIAKAFLKEDCTGTSNSHYKNYVDLDGIAYTFISCYDKWLIFYNG